MSSLPQLQVLLDNAPSFPAPTPPNSASTSSESPSSSIETPIPLKPSKRPVDLPLSPISLPNTSSPIVKPPPTPRPWLWKCHRCYTEYKVACTRRCFECGHEFCTAASVKSSGRGPCRSLFDFAGWEAWGSFRRTVQVVQPAGANPPAQDAQKKRRRNSEVVKDKFATWTLDTDAQHDSRSLRGRKGSSWQLHAVTAEERDRISRQKEKMYIRRGHNCWLHCDAPSECRLSVCTACVEGRARLVGRGKLTAVLVEDNLKKKKNKKKANRPAVSISVKSDEESGQSETEGEKECVIIRTFRRKKAQILNSERRSSTKITTEHVDNLHEIVNDGGVKGENEDEERTTSIPRHVSWPSAPDLTETSVTSDDSKSDGTKPRGLLATLINGIEPEPGYDEEAEDVDFAELMRLSSNLSQMTGSISIGSSNAALVSHSPLDTDVNIISIDDADGHYSSSTETRTPFSGSSPNSGESSGHGLPPMFTTSVNQPTSHAKGFVDLKDLETGCLSSKERKKSQQQDNNQNTRTISFNPPVWKDFEQNSSSPENPTSTPGRFENSASDQMDILSSSTPALGLTTPTISLIPPTTTSSHISLPSPPFTPSRTSHEDPNFPSPTMDHDLSMYIDDEIISPVSVAARNSCSMDTTTSSEREGQEKDSHVLSALRKMQSVFMSGRSQGRFW